MPEEKIFTQEKQVDEVKSDAEPKGRLFTQEEVNEIVRHRLQDRKKEQARVEYNEEAFRKKEQELAEREDAFNKRVELYNRTEFLKQNKYPEELVDLISIQEGESFEAKVKTIVRMIDDTKRLRRDYEYIPSDDGNSNSFPAIGAKHEPKYSNIR